MRLPLLVFLLVCSAHRHVVLSSDPLLPDGSGFGSGEDQLTPCPPNSTTTVLTSSSGVNTATTIELSLTESISLISTSIVSMATSTVQSVVIATSSVSPVTMSQTTSQSNLSPTSTIQSLQVTSIATPTPSVTASTLSIISGGQSSTSVLPEVQSLTSVGVQSSFIMPTATSTRVSGLTVSSTETSQTSSQRSQTSSSLVAMVTPTIASTTAAPPTELPYPWNIIADFFTTASPAELSGFGVGGGLTIILSFILICFCCCCICSRIRKRRKKRYDVHDVGLTVRNPTTASMYANGTAPTRYQQKLTSESIVHNPEAMRFELDQNNMDYNNSGHYNERLLHESAIGGDELNGPSQPQRSQMSVAGGDLFKESTLPELSPLSYPSQMFTSSSHQGLSVDEGVVGMRRLSLSGDYISRIPNGSPSLRHPTRMGRSLENEESKSVQGSRASIPGSKTSIQGSRPSVFSSQTSFLQIGSRSQMYSSALSNDQPQTLLGGQQYSSHDDDTLSLPLSGRTVSPLLQQNSLNSSMEVPTRDTPSGQAPLVATSHDIGSGVKDFASMTCIPNHPALVAADLATVRVPMDLDAPSKPDYIDNGSGRRASVNNRDWGALTTLSGKVDQELKDVEKEAPKKEEKPVEPPKKARSKTMSRLEKLTSLRASLRMKAKKVSFKNKSKDKENVILTNELAIAEQQETTPTKLPRVKRDSETSDHLPSPAGDGKGAGQVRPRAYSEFNYPQLSQPNAYYGGGHMMQPHPQAYQYANYPQLSQAYGFPQPHPMHVPVEDPFGRGNAPPTHELSTRFPGMVTPDYSDVTTPDHGRYGNQDRLTTPDQFLQEGSTSDDYLRGTSPNGFQRATSPTVSYTSTEDRASSPDRFTETSTNSEPYRTRSPNPYSEQVRQPLPTLHERYNYNGYHGDLPSPDVFSTSSGVPYTGDVFSSPTRRPDFVAGNGYPPGPVGVAGNGYPHGPMGGGVAPNGFMPVPGGEFYPERRTSFDHGYSERRSSFDHPDAYHERRGSYDRTLEDSYHSRQGSYEHGPLPGGFPNRSYSYNQKQGSHDQSHDYERDKYMRPQSSGGVLRDRKSSGISENSMNSDLSASRTRVSWNTEVIEYVRTPSEGSDFDLNQL